MLGTRILIMTLTTFRGISGLTGPWRRGRFGLMKIVTRGRVTRLGKSGRTFPRRLSRLS